MMPNQSEPQDWLKVGVAAALSRQYSADQQVFIQLLAQMLETALPEATKIERRGGLFSRKTIRSVAVTLDDNRYTLESSASRSLRPLRTRIVRGIALKNEEIPMEEWLSELGAELEKRTRTNEATREALARMIGVS